MKVTVKTSTLKTAIQNIEALFSSAMGLWNMDCLLTAKEGGKLLVECSGGGAYYRHTITGVTIDKEGSLSINVGYLKNFHFPGDSVTLLVKDKALSFASGRMTGKLDTIGDGDAVTRTKVKAEDALVMPARFFGRLVDSILFSPTVSDAAMKMRFAATDGNLKVMSVDQYRVAIYQHQKAQPEEKPEKDKKGKDKKEKKKRDPVKIEVRGDFDYTFQSEFLTAVKGMFQGDLKIAADSKTVRLSDDHITLYYPATTESIGASVDSFIKDMKKQDALLTTNFQPDQALVLIRAASSVSQQEDGKLTLIPNVKEKQMQVKVTGDAVRTQCTFDLAKVEAKKLPKIALSTSFFIEFLDLINGISEEKDGIRMRVWDKCLILDTPTSFYLMPTLSAEAIKDA